MSVTVKYTGPSPEIEIPALRLTCKHGESIDIEDAQDAASLVAGGDFETSSGAVKKAAKEYADSLAGGPVDAAPAVHDEASVAPVPVAPVDTGAPIPVIEES